MKAEQLNFIYISSSSSSCSSSRRKGNAKEANSIYNSHNEFPCKPNRTTTFWLFMLNVDGDGEGKTMKIVSLFRESREADEKEKKISCSTSKITERSKIIEPSQTRIGRARTTCFGVLNLARQANKNLADVFYLFPLSFIRLILLPFSSMASPLGYYLDIFLIKICFELSVQAEDAHCDVTFRHLSSHYCPAFHDMVHLHESLPLLGEIREVDEAVINNWYRTVLRKLHRN